VSTSSTGSPRPRNPRRPPRRKIRLALALVLVAAALVGGIAIGYAARGDTPPGAAVTESRTVPVVTVTVPAGTTPAP
jgi:hypothetical protein